MQSQEYPQLRFVQARAFGNGRDGKAVRYAVIHYTAGREGPTAAEDGAAYDARRTDGTSCHFFHDSNSTVQTVYTWNRANSAFHKGNRLGIQHELCGTLQTRAQWLDDISNATLWEAARWVANDCVKYALPVRRLTVAQTRASWYDFPNGPRGIVGHVDVTNAYPEDGGSHTDPGPEFPWDIFLSRVQYFVDGGNMATGDADRYAEAMAWRMHALTYGLDDVPNSEKWNAAGEKMWAVVALKTLLSKAALSPEELQAVEDAAKAGAAEGSAGASVDEVREVVDSELDEAFKGATDADS
jgi:N-acetyl-anhydromuramyl-L-alanine amidase AmpD